jgi:CelD/BcsL family acetyltransferase involved in cellulose biosynthesis
VAALSEAPSEPLAVPAEGDASPAPASTLSLDDPRWLAFVASHPQALIFHQRAWVNMIGSCYGWRRFVLAVLDDDASLQGGIPVIAVRGLRRRERWVSLPFSDTCPPLLGAQLEPAAFTRALERARQAAGVESLHVRASLAGAEQQQRTEAVIHTTTLSGDFEAVFANFHGSKVQRNVRRAEREQLTVREGATPADLTHVFYGLHVQTRRRQGMPIQPRDFFSALWEQLVAPGNGKLLLVYDGDRAVAGALFLSGGDTLTYKYGASDASYWRLRPNHLLFAHAIRWACNEGYRHFDWGRSDFQDRGLRDFKSGWAAVEEPLVYTTLTESPRPAWATSGTKTTALRVARGLLRRSPAWVCRTIGKLLYRYAA